MKQYGDYSFPEHIRTIAESYVKYKRSLGFKCSYHEQSTINTMLEYIYTHSTANLTWALTPGVTYSYTIGSGADRPRTIHVKQSLIRQLGLFLNLQGIDAYVLPKELVNTPKDFTPYIFTKQEMQSIFYYADRIGPNKNKFVNTPFVHPAVIRVLYGCGLRVGEALELVRNDVDLDNGVITIRNAKNNVSRLVPLSDSLREYLVYYDGRVLRGSNPYFFPALHCERYSDVTIRNNFRRLLKNAGIGPLSTSLFPRLHDLRHTFCVHALEQMIAKGMDPYCSLPVLSIYLGHKGIESTEIYLRLTRQYFIDVLKYGEKDANLIFPEVGEL
jgi:integrase